MSTRLLSRLLPALTVLCLSVAHAAGWKSLKDDGLHDPDGPGIQLLQQPGDALKNLPRDTAGNEVAWIPALREGVIQPREKLRPETKVQRYDKDVLLNLYGSMPSVRFPHKAHTEWLDCSNCHDQIFLPQRGANKISMFLILQGQQCGVCHGAVAFPLTECRRCHSVPNSQAQAEAAAMEAEEAQKDSAKAINEIERQAKQPAPPAEYQAKPPAPAAKGTGK